MYKSRLKAGTGAIAVLMATTLTLGASFAQDTTPTANRGMLDSFTFNYNKSPKHFDPGVRSGSLQNTALYPLFDRLLTADDAGNVHPWLAESWEYSDDGKEFTMHLKKGVKYQDGTPFDANSVKLNIHRLQTVEGSTQAVLLKSIASVEVVDDHTVRLKLSKPDSTLPFVFSDLAGMMMSPAAFKHAATSPVGTGPFELADYVSGQYIAYKKWDGYWDAKDIHIKNLRINIMTDPTTAYNSLLSEAADAAYISGHDADAAKKAGMVVDAHPTNAIYRIYLNPERFKPFADKRVREAINYAIDRKAIADSLYAGYAEPASQFFPKSSPYYNHNLAEYTYDPAKARELLTEAGYPDGISFVCGATTTDVGAYVAVQAMLAQVGINVKFQIRPSAEAGSSYFNGEFDALIATWGGRLDPLMTLDLTTGNAVANPGRLNTPKFLSLLDEAQATTDPAKRIDIIHQIDAEIYNQALNVPIVLPSSIIAQREGLGGMPSPTWSDRALDFRNVYAKQ